MRWVSAVVTERNFESALADWRCSLSYGERIVKFVPWGTRYAGSIRTRRTTPTLRYSRPHVPIRGRERSLTRSNVEHHDIPVPGFIGQVLNRS
jgi:hypothetical protein